MRRGGEPARGLRYTQLAIARAQPQGRMQPTGLPSSHLVHEPSPPHAITPIPMPIASQRNHQDERAALYPPELLPLFDDAFVTSWDLFEEYVARLALGVFRSTGLEQACRQGATVEQMIVGAGLAPAMARVPTAWILAMLASRGWIEGSAGPDGEAALSTRAAAAGARSERDARRAGGTRPALPAVLFE